jgi:hypothetical protein
MWGVTGTIANPKTIPAFELFREDSMRMILLFATAVMMASCATPNVNGAITGIAADAPRTPPAFRKPPPQTGHWGSGAGYGGRY